MNVVVFKIVIWFAIVKRLSVLTGFDYNALLFFSVDTRFCWVNWATSWARDLARLTYARL